MQEGYSAPVPGDSGAGMFVDVSPRARSSMLDMFAQGDKLAQVTEGNWKLAHIVVQGKLDERMSQYDAKKKRWVHMMHTYAEDIHFSEGRLDRAIASLRKAADLGK